MCHISDEPHKDITCRKRLEAELVPNLLPACNITIRPVVAHLHPKSTLALYLTQRDPAMRGNTWVAMSWQMPHRGNKC